jgi:hypothetical protein
VVYYMVIVHQVPNQIDQFETMMLINKIKIETHMKCKSYFIVCDFYKNVINVTIINNNFLVNYSIHILFRVHY